MYLLQAKTNNEMRKPKTLEPLVVTGFPLSVCKADIKHYLANNTNPIWVIKSIRNSGIILKPLQHQLSKKSLSAKKDFWLPITF